MAPRKQTKQTRKGKGSRAEASNQRFASTSSRTASDPLITGDMRQITQVASTSNVRTSSKRASKTRSSEERPPKARATQRKHWTDRERLEDSGDYNEIQRNTTFIREEQPHPSLRSILERDTDLNVAVHPPESTAVDSIEKEPSESPSANEINTLKKKVSELEGQLSKSNERLISVLDRHEEQVKELKKTVCQKNATISLLESCQSSVSKSSGQTPLTEIEDEYRPIMNKIRQQLRAEADDFAREVITYDSKVVRDWRGKVEKASGNVDEKLLITTVGGKDFVAKCPMFFASQGEFFTKPAKQQILLQEVIKSFVDEDTVMADEEKLRCISRLSRTKSLTQWWGRVLSEQQSKCKAALISSFLNAIGYLYIHKHVKPRDEQLGDVVKEQKHARSTLRQYDEHNTPKFDHWRMSPIASIQYAISELEDFEEDLFFKNKAAKAAYLAYRSHEHEHKEDGDSDATILSLARADTWLFVYLEVMKEDGAYGRGGGTRSDEMKKLFKKYLPQALENILKICRLHVADKRSEELVTVLGRETETDRYGNENRKLTTAFRMPSSGLDYLAVKPEYFSKEICPSMGLVKDCYIGRCKPKSKLFTEIRRNELVHYEASDEEF